MNISYYFVFIFLFVCPPFFAQGQSADSPCNYFHKRLKFTPNEELTLTKGTFSSLMYGEELEGCEVKLITNDSLLADVPKPDPIPSFWPKKTASLYENGWRHNKNFDADGPGSSMFGIQKSDTLCLISNSQPATLVEPGKIIQEKNITVTIQCSSMKNF